MELEILASHFGKAKLNGRGFTAQCPAHQDTNPSLTVARGRSGWLVKCQVGCSFFDVVAAAGLSPLDFRFGNADNGPVTYDKTRQVMRDMILEERDIVWRFQDLAQLAFGLDDTAIGRVMTMYPEFDGVTLVAADKMHSIMYAGPLWEWLHDRQDEWTPEVQAEAGRLLWQEYRRQKAGLVPNGL